MVRIFLHSYREKLFINNGSLCTTEMLQVSTFSNVAYKPTYQTTYSLSSKVIQTLSGRLHFFYLRSVVRLVS
jgi:hypothetical protein